MRQAPWPTRRTDPPSYPGRRSVGGGGPRGAPIPSSLRGAGDAAPGDHGGSRMRFHGGHHAPVDKREASTGTRGEHTAFVAARPSSLLPSRSAGNVSWKPLQLFLSPRPPPPAAAHHRQPPPPAPLPRRGGSWEMESRAWWRLEGAAPQGLQLPECTTCSAALLLPPSRPLCLWLSSSHNLYLPTAGFVFPEPRAVGCAKRQRDFSRLLHKQSFLFKTMTDEPRVGKGWQLPEKLVTSEPSPIVGGKGCILCTFEEVSPSLPKKPPRGT